MTEKQITYYLIEKCRLGKKENVAYYLFIDAEWVWDEKNVIMDHLMGYDPLLACYNYHDSGRCLCQENYQQSELRRINSG